MTLLLLYLFTALIISFLCSLLEAVVLTVTQSHIALLIKTKHRSGRLLKATKDNLDRSLSAILTLNTMAHTVGAAGVGSQAQKLFGDDTIAITSAILTFLMLFFSEIIPKTIGVTYWKKMAPFSAYLIRIFIVITYPLVVIFELFSRLIARDKRLHTRMSREEMIVVAEMGQSEGTLIEKEARIIKNLLRLNNIYVQDVMTPKDEIFALHKSVTVDEVMSKHSNEMYTRIPVYDKDKNDIIGIALRYSIYNAYSEEHLEQTLEVLMKPITKVRGSQSLAKVIDEFIQRREHLFLVIDENERPMGLITLEDAIETLLGVEIEDEIDNVEEIRDRTLKQWRDRVRNRVPHIRTS
jgi:CBS domain containing-hemolysin-like protein